MNDQPYLNVSINEPIQFNVIIVLAEGIDQHLGDFQPSHVEAKLKGTHRVDRWPITGYSFTSTLLTCSAVKNGKYMSGSSYFPPPTSVRSIN